MANEIIQVENSDIVLVPANEVNVFKNTLQNIREELLENSYIDETVRVLTVGGYRSAIGSIWNAVVDDLRNKILYRSVNLFNKEMRPNKPVKKYEDFQDNINDEMLLDGAYKIGVISWEAQKVLKHAKETRHLFDGHPRSSSPTSIKALSMIEDCIKYVLSQEYPTQIIDIDEYINLMGTNDFYRNEYAVSDTISDLPDIYKNELINRLFSSYINDACSSILRSNIEFVAPFLWKVLPKEVTIQVSHRVDNELATGNTNAIEYSFLFINKVGSKKYLSTKARKYLLAPVIVKLNDNLDSFNIENQCIDFLYEYAGYIPRELLYNYINGMTQTYIGHIGGSAQYSRTDFYANDAAIKIPEMFEKFDDESAEVFIDVIKENQTIKSRIKQNVKLRRLRTLGDIVNKRISKNFKNKQFIDNLIDEQKEKEFFNSLK